MQPPYLILSLENKNKIFKALKEHYLKVSGLYVSVMVTNSPPPDRGNMLI